MIEDMSLDAVIVASPPKLHYRQARIAIEAGLDVLVEKPMCMTSEEAEGLVALARDRGRVLMVGHTFIYSNLVHEVKRRIDSGELGEILYIYGQRLNLGRVRSERASDERCDRCAVQGTHSLLTGSFCFQRLGKLD